MTEENNGFLDIFGKLEDPRREQGKLHPMPEILFLTLCSVICGAESWIDMEDFGYAKLDFLRRYLPYKNGVPSDDTFRRFYRAIDTEQFQRLFVEWIRVWLSPDVADKVIAIDGKTLRGSRDGNNSTIHIVSAFASEAGIVLGQTKTQEKSNEITAIPELLDWIDVRGAIVTIDAMGCQKSITQKIVDKGGDYLISLKGNQGNLHKDVKMNFEKPTAAAFFQMTSTETEAEKGHGRIEVRRCKVSTDIDWLRTRHPEWAELNSIVAVESERHVGEKVSIETRYFISSSTTTPERLLSAVRQHWGIENQLHWVLDVSFGEDSSRIRKDNAPTNIAIIRHAALNMMRTAKKTNVANKRKSIRLMRKSAGWRDDVLAEILVQVF
jgi:predicted transposase YbfD/YdcC